MGKNPYLELTEEQRTRKREQAKQNFSKNTR